MEHRTICTSIEIPNDSRRMSMINVGTNTTNRKDSRKQSIYEDELVIDNQHILHETLEGLIKSKKQEQMNLLTSPSLDMEEDPYVIVNEDLSRGSWAGKVDFILTCISFAVGLGNVWRFPYLVYKNGGGAFLIPYFIMLAIVGLPIFFMEFALGQFSSLGPIACWIISPLFKGVGYSMVILCWYLTLYYNVIISHCAFYLVMSLTNKLPWTSCDNSWNDNTTCFDGTNATMLLMNNGTRVGPSEQYYEKFVLEISDGLDNFGYPSWKLLLCLLVCWIIVLAVLIKGVKSLGKISYFTAIFPYIMLTVLLIRGIFLPGSKNGIIYYLYPDFERLKDPRVWTDAATQIFFSLSCCNGGLITMASYNKFKNNCCRDAIIVACINCLTSVFAGFVIFINLGFMAEVKNVTVDKVVRGGPGLAFVVYPEALSHMPISPMWSVFFFIMMVTLGLGSQFSLVETVISGFQDELSKYKIITSKRGRTIFRCMVCLIGFLLGIPMLCPGGIYLLTLLDWTVSGYPLLIVGLLEILIISHFYGWRQFKKDILLMTKKEPNLYWISMWFFISPFVLLLLLISHFAFGSDLKYGNYTYSTSFIRLSHIISVFPIILIPILFAIRYCKDGGFILLKEYIKPNKKWGPANDEHRDEFKELIRSSESLKNKERVRGDEDDRDSNFFQSKLSIIDKLSIVAYKKSDQQSNSAK